MPQCHGYFPLRWPHFLLLPAFWSQGCMRSSSWEGAAHTECSAVFSQRRRFKGRSGFIPVQRVVPEVGQGAWCQAQQALRAATSKDRYYSGMSPARARRQETQLSAGVGRSITNNASQYICLAGNVPGTSLEKYLSEERRNSRKLQIQPCM